MKLLTFVNILSSVFPSISLSLCIEHKHLLKTAQLELKKSKRKDYYKVLGVGKNATEDEIKKAYRKRALMHHPGTPTHTGNTIEEEDSDLSSNNIYILSITPGRLNQTSTFLKENQHYRIDTLFSIG